MQATIGCIFINTDLKNFPGGLPELLPHYPIFRQHVPVRSSPRTDDAMANGAFQQSAPVVSES